MLAEALQVTFDRFADVLGSFRPGSALGNASRQSRASCHKHAVLVWLQINAILHYQHSTREARRRRPSGRVRNASRLTSPRVCAGIRDARLCRRPSVEKLVDGLVWNNPAQTQEKPAEAIPIFRSRVHHIDLDVARPSGRERSAKQLSCLIVSFPQGRSDDHYAVALLKNLFSLRPELPHGTSPQGILGKRRRNNDRSKAPGL